jgi:hypothetical protein
VESVDFQDEELVVSEAIRHADSGDQQGSPRRSRLGAGSSCGHQCSRRVTAKALESLVVVGSSGRGWLRAIWTLEGRAADGQEGGSLLLWDKAVVRTSRTARKTVSSRPFTFPALYKFLYKQRFTKTARKKPIVTRCYERL